MTTHVSRTRTRMIDDGTLSPKVTIPTGLLLAAGVVLMLLDQTGVLTLDDTLWITLLGAGGVTGVGGYSARPGAVIPDPEQIDALKGQRGLADPMTLLVQVIVVVILVVLAVWLIRELL